jgi:septum site-determining protein MinD
MMTKFIAIVSGKGGVGKTTTALSVGQALAALEKKVILVDANIVTPNIAINLGMMNPQGTLNKFLRKEQSLKEIIYLHESGLSVIPASPSYSEFAKTSMQKISKIFDHLQDAADYVLIDSPSGLGYEVTQILKHSDEILVVVNPTLSSVMDGLKTLQLAKAHGNVVAGVVLNMSNKGRHELKALEVSNILNCPILANVPHSAKVRKALHKQMPLPYIYPRSKAAKQFHSIAQQLSFEQ